MYQTVEDYLPDVFASALNSNQKKARALFALVRGLDRQLDCIAEALMDADEHHQKRWQELRKRIKQAADARNEIAHASPVQHGGKLRIALSKDPNIPPTSKRIEAPRMELHKRSKNAIWTTETMRAEYERSSKLFSHLIAFTHELRGEKPPKHLLEA